MAEEVKVERHDSACEVAESAAGGAAGARTASEVALKGWLWKFPSESVSDPGGAVLDRAGGERRSFHVLGVPRRLYFVLDGERMRCLTGSPDDVHPSGGAPPIEEMEDTSVVLRSVRRISPGLDVPNHIQIPTNMREGCVSLQRWMPLLRLVHAPPFTRLRAPTPLARRPMPAAFASR